MRACLLASHALALHVLLGTSQPPRALVCRACTGFARWQLTLLETLKISVDGQMARVTLSTSSP